MLSGREQDWALRRLVEGHEVQLEACEFRGYRRGAFEALSGRTNGDRKLALLDYLTGQFGNGREVWQGIVEAKRPASSEFLSYADLDLPPIEWCWKGWMANGLLTILAAQPGVGKSLIALDLARRMIHGMAAPDGQPFSARSQNVLYVDGEDMPRATKERGTAWGMNLGALYPMLPPEYGTLNLEDGPQRDQLIEMAHTIDPGLIVVDSFATVTPRGDAAVEEVRPVLSFLKGLAQDQNCAVLLIHHIRKRPANVIAGQKMDMDALRGSSHIAAAGRTIQGAEIVQTGPQMDLNGPRRLSVLKSNIGRVPEALGFELVPVGEDDVRIQWGNEPAEWHEPTEADKCAEWLVAYLESVGEERPKQIIEDAEEAGFKRTTVYNTRRDLLADRIESTAGRRSPKNKWRLVEGSGG